MDEWPEVILSQKIQCPVCREFLEIKATRRLQTSLTVDRAGGWMDRVNRDVSKKLLALYQKHIKEHQNERDTREQHA